MHVCVGHGFHKRFMESLFNWLAHFHLCWKLPACASRRRAVTIIHILLYPGFSLFLEEMRKGHVDQVGAAVQRSATVSLLCWGTDVLFHCWVALQNYHHSQYAAVKHTWLSLERGEKNTFSKAYYNLDLMASGILFIQNAGFIRTAQQAHVCLFPGCYQKYLFLMPCLVVHLVLDNSAAPWSFAVTMTSSGVCIQLTKQFCCSGSGQSSRACYHLESVAFLSLSAIWEVDGQPLNSVHPCQGFCSHQQQLCLSEAFALTHHKDPLQVATQTFNIILTHPYVSKDICGWYFLKV